MLKSLIELRKIINGWIATYRGKELFLDSKEYADEQIARHTKGRPSCFGIIDQVLDKRL